MESDGDFFKKLFVSVMNSDGTKEARADNDESFCAAAGDVGDTVWGLGPHDELLKTVNEVIADSKRLSCNYLYLQSTYYRFKKC